MKLDMAALKLGGQETEVEEDGFLGALNTEAGELWVIPMTIKERISQTKQKIEKLKGQRNILQRSRSSSFSLFHASRSKS